MIAKVLFSGNPVNLDEGQGRSTVTKCLSFYQVCKNSAYSFMNSN